MTSQIKLESFSAKMAESGSDRMELLKSLFFDGELRLYQMKVVGYLRDIENGSIFDYKKSQEEKYRIANEGQSTL